MSEPRADYALDDSLPSMRDGLSVEGTLYALPFYVKVSITYHRRNLFQQAGLRMPEQPTWAQFGEFAVRLSHPDQGQYDICLRGKASWGENMVLIGTLANAFGTRWFGERRQPEFSGGEWKEALDFYVSTLKRYGPPGASSNGSSENLALFNSGKCVIWMGASVTGSFVTDKSQNKIANTTGFTFTPREVTDKGASWPYSWVLVTPASPRTKDAAKTFATWVTSQAYGKLVADREDVASAPPGTHTSAYSEAYLVTTLFARATLELLKRVDPNHPTLKLVPYVGIQLATIPEFQAIGIQVGKLFSVALTEQVSSNQVLVTTQQGTTREMKHADYLKQPTDGHSHVRRGPTRALALEDPDGVAVNTSALDTPLPTRPTHRRLRHRQHGPGWLLASPSVALLLLWVIVPLDVTLYFLLIRYSLLYPDENAFVSVKDFTFFVANVGFLPGALNILLLVGSVLATSVASGVLIVALLEVGEFLGCDAVRVLLILPFFIMPTISAPLWKNLIFHPVPSILVAAWCLFGAELVDWLAHYPLLSIILIVPWQWLPLAILILIITVQSLDQEQKEAARLDGTGPLATFQHLTLPRLTWSIVMVLMIETIFLLSVFAEILTTTNGGLGYESTNLAYLIYNQALLQFDVGMASAGDLIAVLIANIAAIVSVRTIGRSLTKRS